MEERIFEVMQLKNTEEEIAGLLACSEKTEEYGLTLTREEAAELVVSRNDSLKKYRRVEFGRGMLDKLVYTF